MVAVGGREGLFLPFFIRQGVDRSPNDFTDAGLLALRRLDECCLGRGFKSNRNLPAFFALGRERAQVELGDRMPDYF